MQWSKKTLMSIFIAAIMILSVIGFAFTFTEPPARLEYNNIAFAQTVQGLQAKINGTKLTFYYFPGQLEDIAFDEGAKVALEGTRVIWLSYDPNDLYASEIADVLYYMEQTLDTVGDMYVQRGLVNNTDYPLPEITCANATVTVPVLVMQSNNETGITHANGCITATAGSSQEVYQVGDRLLYQAFGVMD